MFFIKLAWKNIWRNKKRSLIMISSIFFSMYLATFATSINHGIFGKMIKDAVRASSGHFQISKKGYQDNKSIDKSFVLHDEVKRKLAKIDGIDIINKKIETALLISSETKTKVCSIFGVEPDVEEKMSKITHFKVKGKYLTKSSKGIILSKGLANFLKVDVGDEIILYGQGYHGITAAYKCLVEGIFDFKVTTKNNTFCYMNLKTLQNILSLENRVTNVLFLMNENSELDEVISNVKKVINDKTEITDWKVLIKEVYELAEIKYAGNAIFLSVLYIIVFFGILGTVIMMTMEREREFAILISIGMKRVTLFYTLFLEVCILAFNGIVVGLIAAYPTMLYLYHNPLKYTGRQAEMMLNYGMDPILQMSLAPYVFYRQVFAVIILALITTIYPLINVKNLNITEKIRN